MNCTRRSSKYPLHCSGSVLFVIFALRARRIEGRKWSISWQGGGWYTARLIKRGGAMSLSEWIAQEEKGQDKLATDASISLYFFCRFQWYSYHARAPGSEVERDKNCLVFSIIMFFILLPSPHKRWIVIVVLGSQGIRVGMVVLWTPGYTGLQRTAPKAWHKLIKLWLWGLG